MCVIIIISGSIEGLTLYIHIHNQNSMYGPILQQGVDATAELLQTIPVRYDVKQLLYILCIHVYKVHDSRRVCSSDNYLADQP